MKMELDNTESSSSAAKRKRKKRKRKSNALCNNNDSGHDCPEGASLMQDIPLQEKSRAEATGDISSITGLIAESKVELNSGLIEAQSNSVLVCSENKKKRKRQQKQKSYNAPTTDNTESTVYLNSGLIEAQSNSDLVFSENKRKSKRQQKQKRYNAPPTDNTESTVDIRSNSGLIEAHNNSSLMRSENKIKRERKQLEKKHNAPKTDNTDADLQKVTSKMTTAPFKTVALVDMIPKKASETAPLEVEALGDTSTKMDLAAEMKTSVDMSTMIHSAQNLSRSQRKNSRKKLRKQCAHVLEHDSKCKQCVHVLNHDSKDCIIPGDKSLNKNTLPDKDSSLLLSVDIPKNESVVKQPNGDVCLFNGHNVSENDGVVNLQMENYKNLEKEDMNEMDMADILIDMKTLVDTGTMIHPTLNLNRSVRKKRKKLRKQGVHVLEHDAAQDHVLPGDNSLSKNMFPEKHSSLWPSVDIYANNELVLERSNRDVCLFNRHNASENNRVVNLQMENGQNSEKEDATKTALAATSVEMNASVDISTMVHSPQNLCRSQRRNLRRKLRKQGARVLEHDTAQDHVLQGDNSLSKIMLPEKHSSLQRSVDIYSNNELVVKQSNGDVWHNASENNRVVNLQMENGKNLEKEDATKMDLAAAPVEMNASVDVSTMVHSLQNLSRSQRRNLRKKLRKQGVRVLEHDAAQDRVLQGDNSLSKNMLPEKHSSLQPSVDIYSNNELVVKRSNGDVWHKASENNRVVNLQMENGKNSEKEDATKMTLAAAPVDISTMVHSPQNLSRSQRRNLRRKLRKQGVRVLEHDTAQDRVLQGDNSLSKNMLPEKHSSLQPSVDTYSNNELVVKQSNADVCLFNRHNASENNRVVNLQMENGKNSEKEDARKMDLAVAPVEMNVSVDTSTMILSAQNLSRSQRKNLWKKLRKQDVHALECHASKDCVLLGDNSPSKRLFPEEHLSFQPSVDICSKNEPVVKQSNGDVILFNGHGTSENDFVINMQMEQGKNLERVDAAKMDLAATPIEMNAPVDTSTGIHSAQKLSRSERKILRKRLRKQGVHVLEHDTSKDRVLTGGNSLSENMFPEKHSSLQPSVDIFSGVNSSSKSMFPEELLSFQPSLDIRKKNDSVVKQSNGDVSLFNGHSTSENDFVINLQMEHGKNLERVDAAKMDLAAAPIEMNAPVDTSTMIHSTQKLSRSEREILRKRLRKQGALVLEHDASKDHVLTGDNSPSKNMSPENELEVKQSNGDVCLFNGNNASENDRVIDLQMANGKHLENKEAKPVPKVAELDFTTVREKFPISEKQSGCSNGANRRLIEKDDVHAESHPISAETRNTITFKRQKIFKTYIRMKRKKCSDSLINSSDCMKEDGDSLVKNESVLPEGQLEQKEKDKVDEIRIYVQDASHGDLVSDEIPAHPKEDNICDLDRSCKLPKEQHVEVETFLPSHLGVIKSDVLHASGKEENHPQMLQSPPERVCIGQSKKKLLVLDVNGLLADVVQSPCRTYKPDKMVSKKAVFKRPYCDEFLRFCFERFNVGVWSSRVKKNLDKVIDFLMGDSRKNLLFCWHASQCSETGLNTIENKMKPLVLKELKKLWEKLEPYIPWEKGEYNETNTLLLDDSPYKALCNPVHTAIFPYPYDYRNAKDTSLGPGGDLRVYLEGLADAGNVQEYVRQNPFGQRAITERNPSWGFYSKVFRIKPRPPPYDGGDSEVANANSCEPRDDGNTSFTCQQPSETIAQNGFIQSNTTYKSL